MRFKDEPFELWLSLISPNVLYVWDNGEPYFGAGVYVGGIYALKKDGSSKNPTKKSAAAALFLILLFI